MTISKYKIITIILSALIPISVFAAGGGGGGGSSSVSPPPPCDADIWECSDWSTCQIDGTQSRVCTLTLDCPTANYPKPGTKQSCAPACTEDIFSCTNWGACNASGEQKRTCGKTSDCPLTDTPKPIETQKCQPSCSSDTWTCSNYSQCENGKQSRVCTLSFDCPSISTLKPQESRSCSEPCNKDEYSCNEFSQCNQDGYQTRTCQLSKDCPTIFTPKPEESRVCPGLKCGYLKTLKERIECRLSLPDQALANEFKILYAPETCKSINDNEEKLNCIRLYQGFGPCWQISVGSVRNACAKKVIGLNNIARGKSDCAKMQGKTRNQCLLELEDKVRYLIVFRMYDLEVKAEELIKRGAPFNMVSGLEIFIENKKQEMYQTANTADWKHIVQETQTEWKKFVNSVRPVLR